MIVLGVKLTTTLYTCGTVIQSLYEQTVTVSLLLVALSSAPASVQEIKSHAVLFCATSFNLPTTVTYHSQLTRLGLENLEMRRLCADILLVYKILFGMVQVNGNEFFTLRNQPYLRGHKYVINKQQSFNMRRVNCFSNRIVNLWNNLPLSTTDFTSLHRFDKFVSNDYLLVYCKLNFT